MTDDNLFDLDASRRSFMKQGALATGGLALGLSAGTAAAQDDGLGGDGDVGGSATLPASSFHADAKFAIVSDSLDWSPQGLQGGGGGAAGDDAGLDDDGGGLGGNESGNATDGGGGAQPADGGMETRMIRYLNTGEIAPIFVSGDVDVGQYDDSLGYVVAEDGGAAAGTPTEEPGLAGNGTGNQTGNESDGGGLFGGLFGGGNETNNQTGNQTGGGAMGTPTDAMAQDQPAVYAFESGASLTGDGMVEASFSSVDASQAQPLLDEEDWWQDGGAADGGGLGTPTEEPGLAGNDTGPGNDSGNDTGL